MNFIHVHSESIHPSAPCCAFSSNRCSNFCRNTSGGTGMYECLSTSTGIPQQSHPKNLRISAVILKNWQPLQLSCHLSHSKHLEEMAHQLAPHRSRASRVSNRSTKTAKSQCRCKVGRKTWKKNNSESPSWSSCRLVDLSTDVEHTSDPCGNHIRRLGFQAQWPRRLGWPQIHSFTASACTTWYNVRDNPRCLFAQLWHWAGLEPQNIKTSSSPTISTRFRRI